MGRTKFTIWEDDDQSVKDLKSAYNKLYHRMWKLDGTICGPESDDGQRKESYADRMIYHLLLRQLDEMAAILEQIEEIEWPKREARREAELKALGVEV